MIRNMLMAWKLCLCAILALARCKAMPAPVGALAVLTKRGLPEAVEDTSHIGVMVPCPSHFDETQAADQCSLDVCKAVGHVDCRGGDYPDTEGGFLNEFGKSFQEAGRQWTTELCNEDSDGDGRTNGEELGDPCCVWRPSALPAVGEDYRISHPGHAEDATDSPGPTPAECQALQDSQGAAAAFDEGAFVDSLYNEGEDRLNLTFSVQEHTLMTNETVYTHAYFPLDLEEDLYIVGFTTNVVNAVHLHHFVVYLCTESFDQFYDTPQQAGFPQQPTDEDDNGDFVEACQQNFFNWAPGGDTIAMPKDMGIKLAKDGGFKAVYLQIHYNNPEGAAGEKDSSGFSAHATSTPREKELAVWWSGSITRIGDIPPKTAAYFNTGECAVTLEAGCDAINVVSYTPHAHFLGNAIWTEHYRSDKYVNFNLHCVGDLGREDAFNYELQNTIFREEEVTVRNGDVVTTTCVYDSMDKTEATPGGLGSQEEMCVMFLLVYPSDCLRASQCLTISRAVSGAVPATAQPPYRAPDLYPVAGTTNYTAVAEDGLAACNATGVFASSLVGDTGPILQQVLASFSEACPGTLTLSEQGLMTPQEALEYECGEPCVDWLINFGVCIATELRQEHMQQYELLTSLPGVEGIDPSLFAPPACHEAVAKKLTKQAGGTFSRATIPEEEEEAEEEGGVTDAAVYGSTQGRVLALGVAVIACFLLSI